LEDQEGDGKVALMEAGCEDGKFMELVEDYVQGHSTICNNTFFNFSILIFYLEMYILGISLSPSISFIFLSIPNISQCFFNMVLNQE
jgi:hypothetical protein